MATESFFSNASLAYLASAGAGKDGKTYSIKPTDGTGDFTFSRGSNLTATRVGPTGLIEKGRENLLTYSNDLTNSVWSKSRVTATTESSVYPNGFSSSNKILETNVTGQHYVRQSHTGISGAVYTASCYIKGIGRNYAKIEVLSLSSPYELYLAEINLTNGSITTSFSGGTAIDAVAIDLGDGWYRISITGLINGKTNFGVQIYPLDDSKNGAYAGDITKGLYVAGFQFENSLAATDYIESGASTGKAGLLENEPRFDYSGGATCPSLLLEPQRVQLVPYTEYIDTSWNYGNVTFDNNQSTSPEGLINAFALTETTIANNYHFAGHRITNSAAGDYTMSGFLKKGTRRYAGLRGVVNSFSNRYSVVVDLENGTFVDDYTVNTGVTWTYKIEDYGNDWYRLSITGNHTSGDVAVTFFLSDVAEPTWSSAGLPIYTGSTSEYGYFYGIQLEAGSYPTSYIPNHSGGSVTRSIDIISKDLTSVINNNQMTMFVDVKSLTSITTIIAADNFGDLRWYHQTGNRFRFYKIDDATWITDSFVVNDGDKIALTLTDTQAKLFVNGAQVGTTFTLTTSFQNFSNLNYNVGSSKNEWNQLLFFSTPLSDADCITLTT